MEKLNEIFVDHRVKTKLVNIFRASYPTVRKALRGGCTVTPLILKIRHTALTQYGGVENKPKDDQP